MSAASAVATEEQTSGQARSNARTWVSGDELETYANRILSPVEVLIFARYREQLGGRVLDVGCGAGRVLSYLLMFGADAQGVDLAPKMVEYCARVFPQAKVCVGDVSSLGECVDGLFDVIIAPDNLLDVFGDAERRRVLAGMLELLSPERGLLMFSTHDLAYTEKNPGPREWETPTRLQTLRKLLEASPADLVRAVGRRRRTAANRRRLGALQERHDDYAIINDFPHEYSLLHYYIRRDAQERQLQELGFELVECLDVDGRTVGPGGTGRTDSLYYIARPAQGTGGSGRFRRESSPDELEDE